MGMKKKKTKNTMYTQNMAENADKQNENRAG